MFKGIFHKIIGAFKRILVLDIKIDIKTFFENEFFKTDKCCEENVPFKPDGLRFPNTDSKHRSNVSFMNCKIEFKKFNNVFEGKGKQFH